MAASQPVDFRSDLLSRPTQAIISAMVRAMRRPAAFGLREDADQRELEERAALLLDKEDALLFATCTAANQAALAVLAPPGTAVATASDPHILTSEAGAHAALSGLTLKALAGGPAPALEEWTDVIDAATDELRMPIAAIVLENTHTRGGGVPLDADYTLGVLAHAHRRQLGSHLDGARLPNAALATGRTLAQLARGFDTVSMSLNKGLCTPVGAILAGSRELVGRATIMRQRLGGGIRPTAIIAAAGAAALKDMSPIASDHRRAKHLAELLAQVVGVEVAIPATNIVLLRLDALKLRADEFCRVLADHGLLALPFGTAVRFVTYHGLADEDVERAARVVAAAVENSRRS